jgi:hypothetical protein
VNAPTQSATAYQVIAAGIDVVLDRNTGKPLPGGYAARVLNTSAEQTITVNVIAYCDDLDR